MMVDEGLTLVSAAENDESAVTAEEAARFITASGVGSQPSQPAPPEEDDDDMDVFDDME